MSVGPKSIISKVSLSSSKELMLCFGVPSNLSMIDCRYRLYVLFIVKSGNVANNIGELTINFSSSSNGECKSSYNKNAIWLHKFVIVSDVCMDDDESPIPGKQPTTIDGHLFGCRRGESTTDDSPLFKINTFSDDTDFSGFRFRA